MTRPGMGRGLAAILPEIPAEESELRELPVESIRRNPRQPRTRFGPDSIKTLAASLADAGVVQPLIVRPLRDGRYELIAGERRWRAAREDLNPVDEARACAALVDDLGLSKEELARRLGRSRPSISNLIRLLDLPDEVLDLLASGELSEGHGRAILQTRGNEARRALSREAAARGWSVRETERRAKKAGPGKRLEVVPHPDQEVALARAEELLESVLGTGVRVRPARRGIRAELHFEDLDQLLAFARERGSGD